MEQDKRSAALASTKLRKRSLPCNVHVCALNPSGNGNHPSKALRCAHSTPCFENKKPEPGIIAEFGLKSMIFIVPEQGTIRTPIEHFNEVLKPLDSVRTLIQ